MTEDTILMAARKAPRKEPLLGHREAVRVLRQKGYTWREVAAFMSEHGVHTDHTKLFRLFKGVEEMEAITIPTAAAYCEALQNIAINATQRSMLKAHYASHNRSITYTALAQAAGFTDYSVANLEYGKLGRKLGEELGFTFDELVEGGGDKFFSSSLGMQNSYSKGEFQLVMHHELAKAVETLGWS